MSRKRDTAILRICCRDRKGLVVAVTQFIRDHNGNIVALDQHVDASVDMFLMRVEWEMQGFDLTEEALRERIDVLATPYQMWWSLHLSQRPTRLAVFVSRESHCLYDLLARHRSGELSAEIPLILSNHETLRPVAEQFDVPFHVFPITRETKASQEAAELALLADHRVELVVLARYMQILSADFVAAFPNRVINIHHSFLPAFAGAKPYRKAWERGVKLIGATAHYATQELDEGPIIAQDVLPVSHAESVDDLTRLGRDVEKIVLARAVYLQLEHRVIEYNNKTVVFG